MGALTAAARHYQRALDLWPPADPARPELLYRLGLALSWHQQQRREVLAASRDAFVAAGDRAGAARAEVQLALLARNSGDPAGAKAHVERAAMLDPDDPAVRASLEGARVLELSIQGRYAEAITLGREAARAAQAQGVEAEFRPGLVGLARSLLHTGEAQGMAVMERAITLSERVGDPSVHFARWSYAASLVQFGDLRRAEVVGRGGRERAVAGGEMADATVVAWYDAVLAAVDYQAGRWDAVLARGERAAAGPDGEPGYPEPWYRPVRARVRLGRGDVDAAIADAQAGGQVSEMLGEIPAAHAARALHARALAAAGRYAEAAELLERLLAEQRHDPARAAISPDQVVLILELEDAGEAKVEGLPEELWPTHWHHAASLLVRGDLDGAAEAYALMGADADAALVRLTAARRHLAAGHPDPARAALRSAVAFWRQAEATAYLREAASLEAELENGTEDGAR
jgi:tetratricopeptide (TPR) repeat protein